MSRRLRHPSICFPRKPARYRRSPVSAGSSPLRRRLRIESLEDRRLLAMITVDALIDVNDPHDGLTTLREAIALASSGDTVNFSVTGSINLSNLGELVVNKSLTIQGPGADLLTIRAYDPTPTEKNGDGSGVLVIDDGDLNVLSDVLISGLTITGGDTSLKSGGIHAAENLVITDCVISNNNSTTPGFNSAGGVFSHSSELLPNSLTIRNSTIDGNSKPNSEGGGIRKRYGSLVIEDSTISDNTAFYAGGGISAADGNVIVQIHRSALYNNHQTRQGDNANGGGGLFALEADVTIADSEFSGNTAREGGGILALGSNLTITDTVVSGNAASTRSSDAFGGHGGGVAFWSGEMSVSRSTMVGNTASTTGGGIHFRSGSFMTVTDSTIAGNSAVFNGGGIWIGRDGATIINSTVSGNTAGNAGGGIFNSYTDIGVRFSTITANTAATGLGGGISSSATGTTRLLSSIVAGNVNGDLRLQSNSASFESLGHNLVGNGNGVAAFSEANEDLIGIAPLLGPLADNGGPTMTHALLAGSPAIDAGDPAATAGVDGVPEFDQRGAPFTRVFDGVSPRDVVIDIGAFELQPLPPAFFGDYNENAVVDAADYVVWRKFLGSNALAPYASPDGDGDGAGTAHDYGVWRANFGRTVQAASGEFATANLSHGAESQAAAMTLAEPPSDELPAKPRVDRTPFAPARKVSLQFAQQRDSALVAWAAAQTGRDEADHDNEIGMLNRMPEWDLRETPFDEAIERPGVCLLPLWGLDFCWDV